MLSSIHVGKDSAIDAADAPENAMIGSMYRRAKMNVPAKQAMLPSNVLLLPNSFLLPSFNPTRAASVSPIAKNDMAIKAE